MNFSDKLEEAKRKNKEAESSLKKDIFDKELRQIAFDAEVDLLAAERLFAASENRTHAIEWSLGKNWQTNDSGGVFVLAGPFSCTVIYRGGSGFVSVVFKKTESFKLSNINDEVIAGHPLFGYGIKAYGAYIIINSPWISELQSIHSYHLQFDPAHWAAQKHYMLCFKDLVFEAVTAEKIEWIRTSSREEALETALEKF